MIEPFYAKLDDDVADGAKLGRKKSEILQDFMDNKIDIVIATTAFGMGIDKPDITTIIHYCLSDSLESYIQESGRGARDEEKYQAKCFILYDKRDIDKNFAHLRRSNLDFGEIKSLVRILKTEQKSQKRNPIYVSLKALHKKLGKDEEDYDAALIKTALLELEKAEIIKRKRTKTQIYATSFKPTQGTNKMQIVRDKLDTQKLAIQTKSKEEQNIDEVAFLELYEVMILIVQNIIQRSRQNSAVSLDELGEIIGSIEESKLVMALKILEQHKILASQNDIALFVDFARAKSKITQFFDFEEVFFDIVKDKFGRVFDLRECNDEKLQNLLKILGIAKNPLYLLKFIIKSWEQLLKLHKIPFKCYFKKEKCFFGSFSDIEGLHNMLQMRKNLANGILAYICRHYQTQDKREFYLPSANIYDEIKQQESSLSGFHFVLLNMSEILDRDFDIRGGRLIYHTKECPEFDLEKLRQNAPYKKEHYNDSFKVFMAQKVANIHLLQAFLDNFAKNGEAKAKSFIQKYFSLKQKEFLQEYNIDDRLIKSPISRDLLDKIIATLNDEQSKILDDKSRAIMIYAGPGSGKTKTLVHKMAHLLTKEEKKSENFLMLAHSRVAVRI